MKYTLWLIVVIGVLFLSGCGNDLVITANTAALPRLSIESTQIAADNGQVYSIVINDHQLLPGYLQINAGDSIEFINKDNGRYSLIFNNDFEDEILPSGTLVEHKFTSTGQVRYTALFLDKAKKDEETVLQGVIVVN